MDREPKTNTNNDNLRDQGKGNGESTERNEFHSSDSLNPDRTETRDDRQARSNDEGNDTDKYLAMEQPGVTYTNDHEPTVNSDNLDYGETNAQNKWEDMGNNSQYSEAFNQDDYILQDNLDLDEDQNQSISSDDDDFEETNERYTNG